MRKVFALFMGIVLALVLVSCSSSPNIDEPPEIRFGEDICEECNMIISEPRFAAAYSTADGTRRIFDDIGGMCTHHAEHQEEVARFWVHDYETEEWLSADEATFVMNNELYTPMAFGVVAFQDPGRAEALIEESGGMLMSFDELLAFYEAGGEMPEHEHEMSTDS